jgi:hypothetical protein
MPRQIGGDCGNSTSDNHRHPHDQVKARISPFHTEERGGFAGTLVTEIIYADEI